MSEHRRLRQSLCSEHAYVLWAQPPVQWGHALRDASGFKIFRVNAPTSAYAVSQSVGELRCRLSRKPVPMPGHQQSTWTDSELVVYGFEAIVAGRPLPLDHRDLWDIVKSSYDAKGGLAFLQVHKVKGHDTDWEFDDPTSPNDDERSGSSRLP